MAPVGIAGVYVLAIAAGALFGLGGVLLGLRVAVRLITRDEERYSQVLQVLGTREADFHQLRIEWGKTLENLEQLATTVERGRRRAAASLSSLDRRENGETEEPAPPPSVREQRDEIRRRMSRVG